MRQPQRSVPDPYVPQMRGKVDVELINSQAGRVQYESWLNAWFMHSLAKGELKDLLGEYREFLNLVPTTFNKVMDVFLTHATTLDSVDVIYKYTCVELKSDRATEQDLTQVLRYEDWLARKLAGGDKEMIQSILVAKRYTDAVIDYVTNRRRIEEKTVRLIVYHVTEDKQGVDLQEVSISA